MSSVIRLIDENVRRRYSLKFDSLGVVHSSASLSNHMPV